MENADKASEETPNNDTHIIFSDIDGTLVHYPSQEAQREVWADDHGLVTGPSVDRGFSVYKDTAGRKHRVMQLPPSTTGLRGIIGARTLSASAALRANGYPLILVSGARSSTVLQRLPFLPFPDALVTENGGRIFHHDATLLTAAPFLEDEDWRKLHADVAGPADEDGLSAAGRMGLLWDVCRKFVAAGWVVDTAGYSTGFRVTLKGGQSSGALEAELAALPAELTSSFNLGVADVYPATSGKAAAALHLMKRLGAAPEHCSLMCDDDNDLGLAAVVGKVFLVSKTSQSVVEAAAADPHKFTVATTGGILATEEMFQALGDHLGAFIMG